MNRRNFIRLTALTGTGLIALPSLGYVSMSNKDAAVGVIMNDLDYLKLEKEGVEQFVDDYFKNHYINTSLKAQLNLRSCYYLGIKSKDSRFVSELVYYYLLSTDFFTNKMDESKPVKYISIDPVYKRPCSNPFSYIYYPS